MTKRLSHIFRFVLFLLALTGVFLYTRVGVPTRVEAATSDELNFQARLLTGTGTIVADGNYNVEFKLFNASTSSGSSQGTCTGDANCLWTETYTGADKVTVHNGYLSVHLGSLTNFPNIDWSQDLFVTMNVGGTAGSPTWDGEMTPRLKLTAVPYAMQSAQAEKLQKTVSGFLGTLQFPGSLGQATTYNLTDPGQASVDICLSTGNCGGAGVTFQSTYNNSNPASFTLNSTNGGLTVKDNATPIGAALLSVTDNGGTVSYLSVDASGITVTGTATISSTLTVTGGSAVLGNATTAGVLTINDGNGATGTLGVNTLTQSTAFALPDVNNATAEICVKYGISNAGNCAGAGGGLTGTGTAGKIAVYTGSGTVTTLGSSWLTQNSGNSALELDSTRDLSLLGGNLSVTGTGAFSGTLTVVGNAEFGDATTAGSLIINDGAGLAGTVTIDPLTQATTFTLPDLNTATAEICLKYGSGSSNCAGAGGGLTGSGTGNRIPVYTGVGSSTTLGNSYLLQSGTALTLDDDIDLVVDATDNTFAVDATNNRVGVGTSTPAALFSVGTTSQLQIDASGNVTTSGTINSNTFNSTTLTFSGANPTISPSTTNTGLNVNPNGTGTLALGNTGTASTIQVGNTTGAVVQTINVGNNATASSETNVTIGSTIGASTTTIQAGSGGLVLNTSTISRSATGTTTIDLVDGANTILAIANSGAGVANLTVDGSITAATGLTVSANGITVTGNSTITGTLGNLTGLSSSGNIDFASLSAGGLVKAAVTTGRLSVATAGTDYEVPLTFNNGLTRSSNTVKLGGTLTADTDIPLGGFNLTLSGSGKVGIGTSSTPSQLLSVGGTTGNFAVDTNGAVVAVGVNAGSGLLQGTGGLTLTGTTAINTTGSATTSIGNSSADVTITATNILLNSSTLSRTAAGTTTFDLVDTGNTTFALTNSSTGVANFTVDGSITAATGLTVSANGITVTGNSTITGTLSGLTGLSSSGNIDFASLNAGGLVKADVTTGRLSLAVSGTDYETGLTFNNGLTRTTNTVTLGGNLTGNTTIGLNSNTFTFDGTGDVTISAAGALTAVGVDAGTGLLQGTGGLTLTGTTSINGSGTANTTIGNSAGGTITIGASSGSDLALQDAQWSVTGAGAASFNSLSIGGGLFQVLSDGHVRAINGTVGAPAYSFTGDTDSGIFQNSADTVDIAAGGISSLRVGSNTTVLAGALRIRDGTVGVPSLTFTSDTDTGLYRPGADTLAIVTGGTERINVSSTGTVGIGLSGAASQLLSVGGTTGNFTVDTNGAVVAVGVNAGSGLLQGTGGLTLTGTTQINTSGTANTTIGNTAGGTITIGASSGSDLALQDAQWSVTGAGAATFTSINAGSGTIQTTGLTSTGTLSVSSTSTFTGLATFNGGLTVTTGSTFTNASSSLFTALVISDKPTGGNIGTAAVTVDVATTFNVNQTTAGQALSLPSPTATTAGRIIYINNVGSTSFTISSVTLSPGSAVTYIWNGTAWVALTTGSSSAGVTTIGTIDSQTKSADGAVISGTTLYLQTADASNVGLVSTGTQSFAGDKTFTGAATVQGLLTGSAGATIQGTTQINTTGTANTTIGNSAGGTITIGASSGSDLALQDAQWSVTGVGAATFASVHSTGALTVDGNTTLGDASGDTLTITGTAVSIPNSLNFDSNTLFIDAANDRVGVGLTNPASRFTIKASSATSAGGFRLLASGNTNIPAIIYGGGASGDNGVFQLSNGATITTQLIGSGVGFYNGGNFGIGDSSPAGLLTVGSGDLFQVDNTGAITAVTGYTQASGAFAFSGGGNFSVDSAAFDVTTAGAISGVTTLNTSGIITVGSLGSANTDAVVCRNSSNQLATCSSTFVTTPVSGSYLQQVPATTAANTVTPTANSVVGLTVNGTSGTAATAASIIQSGAALGLNITSSNTGDGENINLTNTSGTQTNGLAITRNGAGGTTTNLLNLTNTAGTAPNAISLNGTFTKLINSTNFNVTNAGAITAVGVDSGTGLLQGTGGLTLTGTTQINASGTANTTIGNSAGGTITIGASSGSDLALQDAQWSITGAGAASFASVTVNSDTITDFTGSGIVLSSGALTVDDSSSTGFFRNGGNNFGGNATLGTTGAGQTLGLKTAGTTRAILDATGNLAFQQASTISTTTGALTLQPVAGSNLNVTLSGAGDFAVNTNQLYVDTSASNVGIGTSSPTAKLQVAGAVYSQGGSFTGSGGAPDTVADASYIMPYGKYLYAYETSVGNSLRKLLGIDISNNLDIGQSGTALISSVNIKAGNSGYIALIPGGGEALRVTSAGNVGIGDTTPAAALTVGNGDLFQVNSSGAIAAVTGYTQASGAFAFSGGGNFSLDSAAFDVTTAGAVTGVTTLNTSGIITVGTLGSANTDAVVCRNSSNQLATCNSTFATTPTSGSYIKQVPATTAENTITPTAASVVGLTVNGTSGTAATAVNILQGGAATGIAITSSSTGDGQNIALTNTSGTQTNGLLINRNGAGGTTTNLLNLTNTAGTATNALNITGTFTNLINAPNLVVTNAGNADFAGTLTAATGDAFQVSAAGAVTAVGVNAGSGLLQGTGGLTLTGTTSINTTGTANTTIGNSAGGTITIGASSGSDLALQDANWSVTGAGAATFASVHSTGALTVDGNTTLGDASGDTLTINGTAVSIPNNLNFDSNTLFVDAANNRVGIGTASPAVNLDVQHGSTGSIAHIGLDATTYLDFSYASNTTTLTQSNSKSLAFTTGGTERLRVDSAGNVGIGDTNPTAGKLSVIGAPTNASVYTLNVVGDSTQASGSTIIANISGAQSVANTGNYFGLLVNPTYTSTSGSLGALRGIQSLSESTNAGTVGTIQSIQGIAKKSGTGAVSNAYGLYSRIDNTNATGSITNAYGLYIDDSTETGTILNDYGVYQVDTGALNYFGGNVGIGDTSPAAALTVGNGDLFQVNSSGAIAAVTGYTQGSGAFAFSGGGNFSVDSAAFDVTTAGAVSGVTTLSTSGIITVGSLGTASTDTVLCRNGSNQISTCNSTFATTPASGSYIRQVPTTTAENTITPTAASVIGLTVNGTSGTAATAVNILQGGAATGLAITSSSTGDGQNISLTNTSGTQTNGLLINRDGAGGTTTNLLNLTNTAGTATNALTISGTFTNLINAPNLVVTNAGNADFAGTLTAGTGDAFQVSAAGAVTAVGINAGAGLLQGTGGLTISGTTSLTGATTINGSGTANTTIGNSAGGTITIGASSGSDLALQDAQWSVTGAGAATFASVHSTGALTVDGNTTLGDASGDSVTFNAASLTFANASTVSLASSTSALNFDSNTLNIDATNHRVGIGTATPTSKLSVISTTTAISGSNPGVFFQQTGTPSSAPGGGGVSIGALTAQSLAAGSFVNANTTVVGFAGSVGNSSTTGTLGTASGVYGQVFSANNITNANGVQGIVSNAGTGTFTTANALVAATPTFLSSGTDTTANGILINAQKVAGVGTGYGINQVGASDLNYFAGNIGIGDTTPAAALTVGNGDLFQVNSSGAIAAVTGYTQASGAFAFSGGGNFSVDSAAFDVTTGGAISGVTTLSTSGIITVGSLGAANTDAVVCRNSSNQLATCNSTFATVPTSGSYLQQVPATTAANTVTPTAASVVGLTVNGTSGTAATALAISQPGAAAALTIASANNTATNGISFTGTYTNLISAPNLTVTNAGNADFAGTLTAGTGDAFQVSAAGAVTAVGVNSGTGLLQGTGGLTITGATNINVSANNATNINTGTSTGLVTIGGGSGTFSLQTTNIDISNAGVISGATGITSSGTINFSGLTASRLVATDGSKNLVSTITAANLLSSVTGTTGSAGNLVFSTSPTVSTLTVSSGGAAITGNSTVAGTLGISVTNANGLLVQNSGATETVLSVDTTARSASGGNLIKVGNSTGTDTATTILQLDTAQDADVTTNVSALSGGLYYFDNTTDNTLDSVRAVINGTVVTVCDSRGNCNGAGTTLQTAYNNSATSPEIKLNTTNNGIQIQDANTTIGATTDLFSILSSNAASNLFRIQGNGKVGIGTSGNPSQLLSIGGTTGNLTVDSSGNLVTSGNLTVNGNSILGDASGDTLTVNSTAVSIPNNLNFDSNTLFIDATNDRIGIGTAAPTARLHVVAAADDEAISVTGYSLTGSSSNALLDLSGTWNTTGSPTAINLNVTNTASSANSLLLRLQESSSERFSVQVDGTTSITSVATAGESSNLGNSTSASLTIHQNSTTANNFAALRFGDSDGVVSSVVAKFVDHTNNYGDLLFNTRAADGFLTRVTVLSAGNVGIGDTTPAGLLTVGSGDLFQVNGSGDITTANGENLGISTGTTGTLTLDTGTTGAISIGTGANAKTVTIGNTTGASALSLLTGTGNFSLDGVAATTYTLGASTTTGTVAIGGTAQTGNITLGSSSGTNNVLIGNGAGATTVNISNSNTAGAVNIGAAYTTGTITLGGASQTGTITLGQSTDSNTINIGNATIATTKTETVNIATSSTGTGKTVVNIGSSNDGSSVVINTGTGGVNIGDNANTKTIDIGGNDADGTDTVRIATNSTTADTITIGNTSANTAITLNAGSTGGITVAGVQAASSPVALCLSSNKLSYCDANNTASSILQNGNTFGATVSIGSNDAQSVALRTGGSNRFIIDSTGANATFQQATTLGTNSGALTLQPVSGSNLNVTLATTGDFAVNANQLYVDTSAANVGIGTTGPDRKLDVLDASNPQLRLTQADGAQFADFKVDSNSELDISGPSGINLVLTSTGKLGIGRSPTSPGPTLLVKTANASTQGISVVADTNQTANLFQLQDVSNNNIVLVNSGTKPIAVAGAGTSAGTVFAIAGQAGGDTSGTGTTAGSGSAVSVTAGAGGTSSGGTNVIGGVGGAITLTSGAGGASTGTAANANGGDITLQGGAAGAGGSGAAGAQGNIILQSSGGNVGIGDSSPAALLTVGSGDKFQVNASGDITTVNGETLNINTGTTGDINIDTGTTGDINIGTGSNDKDVTIGSTNTTSSVTINTGTGTAGGDLNLADTTIAAKRVDIGSVDNSGTSTINVATASGSAQTIKVGGTGASGGSNASTTVNIQAGASLLNLTNTGSIARVFTDSATAFQIQNSTGASQLSLDTTNSASGLNLASNGGAETAFGSEWSTFGAGASVTRDTTAGHFTSGAASASIVLPTGVTNGVKYVVGTAAAVSKTYIVSFSIKSVSGSITPTFSFSPDGTTSNNVTCTPGTNPTINTSNFIKYSCVFTTASSPAITSTAYFSFASSSASSFYVDNLSIVQQGTTTQNTGVLKVGGSSSQGLTLLQLDTYAGAPFTGAISTLAGAMYFDTTQGKMQCYDGTQWGACGAAPNSLITLTPEYAGAVLHGVNDAYGVGTDKNIGTLSSDFCANSTALTVGTLCSSGDARNFYNWTSVQTNYQSYGVYVTYKLPSTFKAFVGNVSMTGRVDNITNGGVNYSIFRSSGGTISQCGGSSSPTNVVGWDGTTGHNTVNTWQAATINPATGTGCTSWAANDYLIVRIDVVSKSSANAYIENLNFTFSNQ